MGGYQTRLMPQKDFKAKTQVMLSNSTSFNKVQNGEWVKVLFQSCGSSLTVHQHNYSRAYFYNI